MTQPLIDDSQIDVNELANNSSFATTLGNNATLYDNSTFVNGIADNGTFIANIAADTTLQTAFGGGGGIDRHDINSQAANGPLTVSSTSWTTYNFNSLYGVPTSAVLGCFSVLVKLGENNNNLPTNNTLRIRTTGTGDVVSMVATTPYVGGIGFTVFWPMNNARVDAQISTSSGLGQIRLVAFFE